MKNNRKIGAAVAVVLGLALVFVAWKVIGRRGADPDAAPVTAGAGPAAPRSVAASAAVPAAPGRVAPVAHDDDPAGTLRLEGQVIDEHEQPVAHARVAIDANPPRTFETDADGAFAFDRLIARDYVVEATAADGYAGPARLRLGPDAEPITLRLRRGGVVEVAVTDGAGGAPIAGADVELRGAITWSATTGADGLATLRGVGPQWAPLVARASGYAPAAMIATTAGDPAHPDRFTVALVKGAAITGRVVDEAGAPIAGARVVAASASEPFAVVDARRDGVETGPDGAFRIPSAAAGTWRVTATHGEHAPATSAPLTLDGVHDRSGVELVMIAGGVVRGVVHDRGGRGVAGADVTVVVQGHLPWRERRRAFTGADGSFAIAGLPRRAVDVVAWHGSGASAIAPVDLAAARERDVTLVLDVTGAIDGTVVDPAGKPIGDAQVIAEPVLGGGVADRAAWGIRGVQETVTDQAGAFRFAGLPDGGYHVRAARPGASEASLALAAAVTATPGGAPIRIVVPADVRVLGKVAFADGTPPRAFTVAIGDTAARPFASADGAFAMSVAPGTHTLAIAGPGFAEKRVRDVAVADGKDTDVGTITVTPGRSVSGRVLDDRGAPVAGAQVAAGTILSGGGAELYIATESIGAKATETDAAGAFSIDGFGPTAITVVAGKQGLGRSASVRLPPGPASATLDLVLQGTTGLEGKITRSGAPLADTIVIANPVGATSSNFFVATGPDGTFAFDALAAGEYVVYPMLGGGGSRPKDLYFRRVDVAPGARTHVEIDASPGPVTLAITVKGDDGAAVPMAQVFAIEAQIAAMTADDVRDGSRLPATGDAVIPTYLRQALGGSVEIAGVRAGVYTVCAMPITGPVDDPGAARVTCVPARIGAAPAHQQVDVVVPAASRSKP